MADLQVSRRKSFWQFEQRSYQAFVLPIRSESCLGVNHYRTEEMEFCRTSKKRFSAELNGSVAILKYNCWTPSKTSWTPKRRKILTARVRQVQLPPWSTIWFCHVPKLFGDDIHWIQQSFEALTTEDHEGCLSMEQALAKVNETSDAMESRLSPLSLPVCT